MENARFGGFPCLKSGGREVIFEWNKVVVIEQIDLRFQTLLGKTVCFKRSIFILDQ